MPIAARNLLIELVAVFGLVFLVLTLISVGGRFSGYLEEVVNGRIPLEILWTVFALRLPEFVQLLVPLSLFLAVLITLSRYHSEQEFSVLIMAGLPPMRLLAWLAILVLPLTVMVGLSSLWLTPSTAAKFDDVMDRAKSANNIDQIPENSVVTFENGTQMVYVDRVSTREQSLGGIVYARVAEGKLEVAHASTAQVLGAEHSSVRNFVLSDGVFQSFDLRASQSEFSRFSEFRHRFSSNFIPGQRKISTIPTKNLTLDDPYERSEFHWRVGLPLLNLFVALCAVGIAKTPPRRGRYSQIASGLLLFIAYIAGLVLGRNALVHLPAMSWLGLFPVHALFLCLGLYLLRRSWRPS